jgi:transcription antitermination factor NusG
LANDPEMSMESWLAVWTQSRHEQIVRSELARRQIETFLPTVTRWSRWKDRRKRIDWPLFPGYCFARVNPSELLPVLKCTGVVTVVSFAGRPAAIPDHEIDAIRRLVASNLPCDPCPLIKEGMMVEIVRGPLAGVIGRLVRKSPQARVVLAVELLNRGFNVDVEACDVEVAGRPLTPTRQYSSASH